MSMNVAEVEQALLALDEHDRASHVTPTMHRSAVHRFVAHLSQ